MHLRSSAPENQNTKEFKESAHEIKEHVQYRKHQVDSHQNIQFLLICLAFLRGWHYWLHIEATHHRKQTHFKFILLIISIKSLILQLLVVSSK